MKPTLRTGFITIEKQDTYKKGDIVIFSTNILFIPFNVCHRIISIDYEKNIFTTKGDNRKKSKFFEKEQPIDNIIGIVKKK